MFIFAHIFAGALLGLVFWHLTNDRRSIPVCIAGSIIPDLIDKSLGLLFPSVLSSGRTVFHTISLVFIILIFMLVFVRSNLTALGIGFACAIFLHQIFDEMWALPANWYYPLLGPFQGSMIPDYISAYFWFEITNPSEWVFMVGTVVILVKSYHCMPEIPLFALSDRLKNIVYLFVVAVIGGTGLYLVATGLTNPDGVLFTSLYNPLTNTMAGLLGLSAAFIMSREKYDTPR